MTERRSNFQDPIGLVRRMLASGDPAARSALGREALRYLLLPLDWVLGRFEQRRLKPSAGRLPPIVLIVGSPRSGSTLLYQVLAGHLPVSYPSNLTALFERARSPQRPYRAGWPGGAVATGPITGTPGHSDHQTTRSRSGTGGWEKIATRSRITCPPRAPAPCDPSSRPGGQRSVSRSSTRTTATPPRCDYWPTSSRRHDSS